MWLHCESIFTERCARFAVPRIRPDLSVSALYGLIRHEDDVDLLKQYRNELVYSQQEIHQLIATGPWTHTRNRHAMTLRSSTCGYSTVQISANEVGVVEVHILNDYFRQLRFVAQLIDDEIIRRHQLHYRALPCLDDFANFDLNSAQTYMSVSRLFLLICN